MTTQQKIDWIKARLPSAVTFQKNGLTETTDQAVATALEQENNVRELALASLWDIIASEQLYDVFQDKNGEKDTTRSKALAQQKAEYWRSVASSGEIRYGIDNVPADFGGACVRDEYGR